MVKIYESKNISLTADYLCNGSTNIPFYIECGLPIKKVRITTSYLIAKDSPVAIFMNNNTLYPPISLASFLNTNWIDGALYWIGNSNSDPVNIEFPQPKVIQGSHSFSLQAVNNAVNIAVANLPFILMNFEFSTD